MAFGLAHAIACAIVCGDDLLDIVAIGHSGELLPDQGVKTGLHIVLSKRCPLAKGTIVLVNA